MVATQDEALTPFLKNHFGHEAFKLFQLAGDASNRRYYRVLANDQTSVLMRWEPFDPKNYPFLSVLNHFAENGVHVPKVLAQSPGEGLVLLEDLGDLTLERKFWESQNPQYSLPFYKQAIDEIIKVHFRASNDKRDCTAFKIQFDVEKLLWEMNYGLDNLIVGVCKYPLTDTRRKEIVGIFTQICERLHNEPKFIAHRDYHSRNLMIKFDKMYVIDFQDARMGPIQYDLVSLLRDSYVNMSDEMANILIEDYLQKAKSFLPKDFSRTRFDEIYEVQTIQRCFKACGSFASFYNQRQDRRYLKYISHTLRKVMKSLNQLPEYRAMSDLILDAGALEKKYEAL